MAHSAGGEVKAEPNLTPVLDMVFQLITFFMLVINFKSAELDLTLNLPVIGSAQPVADHGSDTKLLILNVKDVDGRASINLYGRLIPQAEIKRYLAGEAQASMMAAKPPLTRADIDSGRGELSDTVVIRADDRTPFGEVYSVVAVCQDEGFRRFALKALCAPQRSH
jgi:biopolymer transport protein ExbD